MVEGLDGEGLGLQPLQVGSIPPSTTAQNKRRGNHVECSRP